jgi:hypothetical protein
MSPYLILSVIMLSVAAAYIFYKQNNGKYNLEVLPDSVLHQQEPLPIVTEPPLHLQPIVEETREGFGTGCALSQGNRVAEGFAREADFNVAPKSGVAFPKGCPKAKLAFPDLTKNLDAAPVEEPFASTEGIEEGFATNGVVPQGSYGAEGFANGLGETLPSNANPFMNVLVPEYKYNPERAPAAEVDDPKVKQGLDDFFRTNFYNDPTDVFGKSQDQRQFVTMPSTSIPNDRESFMKWCYNIVPQNCKSGGRAGCLPGTDGGPIASLNQEF